MTQLFANNAQTVLANALSAAATAFTVAAGTGAKFPAIASAGDYFKLTLYQMSGQNEINHEVVKVTGRAGDVFTIVREQEGTTARAFNAADPVALRLTAAALAPGEGNIPVPGKVAGPSLDLDNSTNASAARVSITGQPGQEKSFKIFSQGGYARWSMAANSTAEAGGNAGSDFGVNRYNDAGVYVDTPLYINRANGAVALRNAVAVYGPSLDVDNGTATTDARVSITGKAGQNRYVAFYTAGLSRWNILANATAEAGGNAGTDFSIARYTDAGAYIDAPFSINRATGVATFSQSSVMPKMLVRGGAPIITFEETDQTGTAGVWRIACDGGTWRLDANTAAARDISTYRTMFEVGANGTDFVDTVISRMNMKDCALTIIDKGNSGTAGQTFDYTAGSVQFITVTGAHSWGFSNWPIAGNWGAILVKAANAGSAAIAFGVTINWQLPKGGYTTVFADYLTAIGRPALQTAGIDQFLFWNDSTAIFGKLL